jgi:hypothetical protein
MKALYHLGWLLALLASAVASAQVLVYSGNISANEVGSNNTRTVKGSFVVIIDVSETRDPQNFLTLLSPNSEGKVVDCRDFSALARLVDASGSPTKHYGGILVDGFVGLQATDEEQELFLVYGVMSSFSMGKGKTPLECPKSLSGPYLDMQGAPPHAARSRKGTMTLRIQTKESQIANTPDSGGATPGFATTVTRQREILAKKLKLTVGSVCH